MCGIVGIVHNNQRDFQQNILHMNDIQAHRGPDASGVEKLTGAILGHTRLSIIDVASGHQPMSCNSKRLFITFNGEIYGYKEIKKGLEYPFKTNSDTEVLIALYKQYGSKMLSKLSGMFAFAIWDDQERTLFLARDRFGEKPLYYGFTDDGDFIFASEIKAIIASKLLTPKVSEKAIGHYLQRLYIDPLETIYENIHALAPGSFLTYNDGKLEINRYFNYPITQDISLADATEIFQDKFDKSVQSQLIADVDVGAFLSGGLDSSTVVAIAQKYNQNLKTFSFGFEGTMSELSYAKEIANRYGTDHHELLAGKVDIADLLLVMADVYDEPFADSSNISTYLISKLAREHSKVILTGDGADELLGGYEWWYDPLLGIGSGNNYFKELAFRVLAKSFLRSYQQKANRLKYGRKFTSVMEGHLNRPCFFSDSEVKSLLNIDIISQKNKYNFDEENTINDALKIDLQDYMPGDILVKIDRASMANSLELRAPFLDVDFATFCISLPASLKLTTQKDKLILRKAYQDVWTDSIRKRNKQGFGGPVKKWLKLDKVIELKNEYFRKDQPVFSYISFDHAENYFFKDNYQTWVLLVLSIWFDKNSCKL